MTAPTNPAPTPALVFTTPTREQCIEWARLAVKEAQRLNDADDATALAIAERIVPPLVTAKRRVTFSSGKYAEYHEPVFLIFNQDGFALDSTSRYESAVHVAWVYESTRTQCADDLFALLMDLKANPEADAPAPPATEPQAFVRWNASSDELFALWQQCMKGEGNTGTVGHGCVVFANIIQDRIQALNESPPPAWTDAELEFIWHAITQRFVQEINSPGVTWDRDTRLAGIRKVLTTIPRPAVQLTREQWSALRDNFEAGVKSTDKQAEKANAHLNELLATLPANGQALPVWGYIVTDYGRYIGTETVKEHGSESAALDCTRGRVNGIASRTITKLLDAGPVA